MTTIKVGLGVTLCTNPDMRNFLRVSVEAEGIDVDGDVEAQAQAALEGALKVMVILDDGLKTAVTNCIIDSDTPGLTKDTIAAHDKDIKRINRILVKAVGDIKSLTEGGNGDA